MRIPSLFIAALIVCVDSSAVLTQAEDEPTPEQRAEACRRHGLDPGSSLESRLKATPASVLKMFEGLGGPTPTVHTLTDDERRKLSAAFEALTPLHRRFLGDRLRTISFLDGMPNTALTSTVNLDEPYRLFDITIRASVMRETATEWLTQKEQTCFNAAGSPKSVAVEAGDLDALAFALLHEATHVVDATLDLTPHTDDAPATEFTRDVWEGRLTHAPRYRDPLLEGLRYRRGGGVLPVDRAEAAYQALRKTPFVSLYGSSNCHDDIAELVAVRHWTEVLKQPYRIVVREAGRDVSTYEPMKSDLVRGRLDLLRRFEEAGG